MRVLLVTAAWRPADDYGGPVTKVAALASGLAARGHHPTVVCADYGPGRSRVAAGRRTVDGIDVVYVRRLASVRWSPLAPQAASLVRSLAPPPDVVHVLGVRDGLGPAVAWGARRAGVPYVVEPLGMLAAGFRSQAVKGPFDRLVTAPLLAGAQAVIASSPAEDASLSDRLAGGPPVVLRWNPLLVEAPAVADPDEAGAARASLGIPPDAPLAAFVGRISRTKGLSLLVRALADAPGTHLVIAGPDDRDGEADDLRATLAAHADAASRTHLVGPVDVARRDGIVRAADVVVLPSRSESFGNAAAEALALGTPVIVSEACGIAPLVRDLDAGLVLERDVGAWASALRSLRPGAGTSIAPAWAARGQRGAAIREQLSVDRIAEAQEAIYRSALQAVAPVGEHG